MRCLIDWATNQGKSGKSALPWGGTIYWLAISKHLPPMQREDAH